MNGQELLIEELKKIVSDPLPQPKSKESKIMFWEISTLFSDPRYEKTVSNTNKISILKDMNIPGFSSAPTISMLKKFAKRYPIKENIPDEILNSGKSIWHTINKQLLVEFSNNSNTIDSVANFRDNVCPSMDKQKRKKMRHANFRPGPPCLGLAVI